MAFLSSSRDFKQMIGKEIRNSLVSLRSLKLLVLEKYLAAYVKRSSPFFISFLKTFYSKGIRSKAKQNIFHLKFIFLLKCFAFLGIHD